MNCSNPLEITDLIRRFLNPIGTYSKQRYIDNGSLQQLRPLSPERTASITFSPKIPSNETPNTPLRSPSHSRVTFNHTIQIHHINHHTELSTEQKSALWYSSEDQQQFRAKVHEEVLFALLGIEEEDSRGLEKLYEPGLSRSAISEQVRAEIVAKHGAISKSAAIHISESLIAARKLGEEDQQYVQRLD